MAGSAIGSATDDAEGAAVAVDVVLLVGTAATDEVADTVPVAAGSAFSGAGLVPLESA